MLKRACRQCDALYLSAGSILAQDTALMADLKQASVTTATVTVSGDIETGASTTVSLCEDPFDIGYRCGQMGAAILSGEDITTLEVEDPDPLLAVKLYNAQQSRALGLTWPKSFHERQDFLTNYTPAKKYPET